MNPRHEAGIDRPAMKGNEHRSLKRQALHAMSWILYGQLASLVLRFVSSIVLTRIFSPEAYGVFVIIIAISTVIGLLTDIGLNQAVIQSPNGTARSFLNTAWTMQVIRGGVIWIVCLFLAAILLLANSYSMVSPDSVFSDRHLPGLIAVASFSSVVSGFTSIKVMTANRNLDLKRLTSIEVVSQALNLIMAGCLGWMTGSVWSFVISLVVTSVAKVWLTRTWLQGPRDHFAWDMGALAELKLFAKKIFLSSAVGAIVLNGDRLLLGSSTNPQIVGQYSVASNLASVADSLSSQFSGSIALPALSEINRSRPDRFRAIYFRMRLSLDALLLALAGFFFASGTSIISLLYDDRYISAGWMLQWLSFGLVFARYNLCASAYVALGKPELVSATNLIRSISLVAAVPTLSILAGASGAIIGIAFHMVPSTLLAFYFNWKLKISNVLFEVAILVMWGVGWLAGIGFDQLLIAGRLYFSGNF